MGRRDEVKSVNVPREQFVATVGEILESIQNALYTRAAKLRADHTRDIDSLDEFREFFTPQNEDQPEIHGGFARGYFFETPAVHEMLKEMKVTIRCLPLEHDDSGGRCLFTGVDAPRRAIFAKAY
jgi:prolyl-tRNA synthetase